MRSFLLPIVVLVGMLPCRAQPQLTNLPTLYITTQNATPVADKETYVPGMLKVVGTAGTPGLYDGPIEIRGRGNATWFFPKKPYRIKLASKYNLLGMPSPAKSWVLLANYVDNTLIRNGLAFEVSKYLGFEYTCAYRFVDVYLNGTYLGNYTLTDQVQVEANRVQVEALNAADTDLPTISGGYFLQEELYAAEEPNYFQTPRAHRYSIKYPDEDDINSAQFDYIRQYINDYETRLFSPSFLDPVSGYNPVVDRASQVNWYIACELTGNPDSFLSVYMYKRRNNPRLYFGPLWDNDYAFNNSAALGDVHYKRMSDAAYNNEYIQRMLQDPEFRNAVKTRWQALRAQGIYRYLDNAIVSIAQELSASQQLNYQLWPAYNVNLPPTSYSYAERISQLRTFLNRRIAFLDYQFTGELKPDTYYRIANRNSQKVLVSRSDTDFNLVQRSADPDNPGQHWMITAFQSGGDTYYTIKNRITGRLVTSPDQSQGSQLTAAPTDAGNPGKQRWRVIPLNTPYSGLLGQTADLVMGNANGVDVEGNAIVQVPKADVQTNTHNQWFFIPTELAESPLPVTLTRLEANADDDGIRLQWQVTSHTHFNYFVIERSFAPGSVPADSIGCIPIRDVQAGSYEFTDRRPCTGKNYYRLKLVDKDGSFSYSRYVAAEHPGIRQLSAFPVPARSVLTVSFTSDDFLGKAVLGLFNDAGQKVRSRELKIVRGRNTAGLDVESLPPGIYLLHMDFGDSVVSRKVTIIR